MEGLHAAGPRHCINCSAIARMSETLGTCKEPSISLHIDKRANPIRHKARNIPLAKIEDEIERLVKENALEPINNPRWSAHVVSVVKPSGDTRQGDNKTTLNTVLPKCPYSIPSVQHLLYKLADGEYFAKLGMAQT